MFIMIKVILIIIMEGNYCFLVSEYSVPQVINECDEFGDDVEEIFQWHYSHFLSDDICHYEN